MVTGFLIKHPSCLVGYISVSASQFISPEDIKQTLRRLGIVGLKLRSNLHDILKFLHIGFYNCLQIVNIMMRTFGSETTAVRCRYLVLQDHQFFRHVIHSPIPLLFPSQTISEEIH
jgi:hypothetical protein